MKNRLMSCLAIIGILAFTTNSADAVLLNSTFDIGDTNFSQQQNGSNPGVLFISDGANGTSGAIRLTSEVNSQNAQIAFDHNGGTASGVIDFDFRLSPGNGGGADGFGFALLNTANHGTSGNIGAFSEEPNLAGSLGVGFDTFDNGGEGGTSASLHFNGALIGSQNLDGQINLESGAYHHARIAIAGNNVDITLTDGDDASVHNINIPVAGLNAYNARLAFNARTGGANSAQDIDNVVANLAGGSTIGSFDHGVDSAHVGSAPSAQLVDVGGVHGNVLQLTAAVNSQTNTVAFADVVEFNSGRTLNVDWDFRMGDGDFGGADGHSFILANVDNFGTSGPVVPGGIAEEPNIAGSFAIGFDTFNNGAGDDNAEQSVSLHFDGAQVANVALPNDPNILENGEFNSVQLSLTEGVGGSLVDVSILTFDGNLVQIYDNFFIAGLEAYDGRIVFSARTGGANHLIQLDNIRVSVVPEPATGLLALMGLAGVAIRRRRHTA